MSPFDIPIYIVNYNNEERRQRMIDRFSQFNITPILTPQVETNDTRLTLAPTNCKRIWAIMLQHLDSIRHYYENSSSPYCIVCEDDVHISKTFTDDVHELLPSLETMQLDLILLGYLLPYKIDMSTHLHKQHFPIIGQTPKFNLHRFPDDIWGCQMYLFTKGYAEAMLKLYTIEYALANIDHLNFNPDWTLTKNGNRVLICPMIAVEEGVNVSGDKEQADYHTRCHRLNYGGQLSPITLWL